MLTTNIVEAHGPAQPLAANISTTTRKTVPLYLGESFFMAPSELVLIAPYISTGARLVLNALYKMVQPYGTKAGKIYAKRKTIAATIGRSLDTVDNSLGEILERNILTDEGALYGDDNGPRVYQFNPPSMWKFDCLKSSAPQPKKCGTLAETIRPITKTKEKKLKEEQNSGVAAPSISSNASEPNRDIIERLTSEGVNFKVATQLAAENSIEAIEQQFKWLDDRIPKDRAATIVGSIKGNWSAPKADKADKAGIGQDKPQTCANGGAYNDYKPQYHKSKKSHVAPDLTTTSTPTSPPPTPAEAILVAGKNVPEKTSVSNQDNARRVNENENEPVSVASKSDVRADAKRAHKIFQSLPVEQQTELLELARKDVQPIFHDRVGVPESPMSLGLWELVMERYSNS